MSDFEVSAFSIIVGYAGLFLNLSLFLNYHDDEILQIVL